MPPMSGRCLLLFVSMILGARPVSAAPWVLCIGPLGHVEIESSKSGCCPSPSGAAPIDVAPSYTSAACGSCRDYPLSHAAMRATTRAHAPSASMLASVLTPTTPSAVLVALDPLPVRPPRFLAEPPRVTSVPLRC